MPRHKLAAESRTEFNLTTASTLQHLMAVGVACAGLWTIIVAILGV